MVNETMLRPRLTARHIDIVERHSPEDCELYEWAKMEFSERYRKFIG